MLLTNFGLLIGRGGWLLILAGFLLSPAWAQSTLPPCDPNVVYTRWTNCQGILTYAIGNKYVGEFRDGNPHGQGTHTHPNFKYVGEWRGGKRNGQGTFTHAGGSEHVGEYRDNKPHGQGTYTDPDGSKYVGEYRDGWRHGQGTYTHADGRKYVGEFRAGLKDGFGVEFSAGSGWSYVGNHKSGRKHGVGLSITTGRSKGENWRSVYIGEFRDGAWHGAGQISGSSGENIVGFFEGSRLVEAASNSSKEGIEFSCAVDSTGVWGGCFSLSQFLRGEEMPAHSTKQVGRVTSPDGSVIRIRIPSEASELQILLAAEVAYLFAISEPLVGINENRFLPICDEVPGAQWSNCRATRTLSYGEYSGEFKDGEFHGVGSLQLTNGTTWFGEWRSGEIHGRGAKYDSDGRRYIGEYKFGKRDGVGTQTGRSYVYTGQWKEDKFHGLGIRTLVDGTTQEGRWENGKLLLAMRIPDYIAGRGPSTLPPVAQTPRQAERTASSLSLSVSPSQPDPNGVVTLTIATNTDTASLKINGDEVGGRADGRYVLRRFARVGDNQFEVIATDRFGNTQRQMVSVNREFAQTAERIEALNPLSVRAVKPRDAVAIIIGIEKYRSVSSADFANRDASIFVDYATRALGIPSQNIRLLVDEKAGAAEILLTFKNWLPTRVSKGKTEVYVFYSGHGLPSEDGNSLYFLPHEANRELLNRTAISQNELVAAIQKSSPKSVTMFIDSCYSGQSRTGETLLASARPISIVAKETSSFPPNFTVISASAPDQISSSSPELRHGIFSYYLMRGMEGEADANKDGQITVAEMQTYLSEQVPRRAMSMNRTQQPQVVGDQSRVLVGR